MKKTTKTARIISALLCCVLLAGLLPTVAFAGGGEEDAVTVTFDANGGFLYTINSGETTEAVTVGEDGTLPYYPTAVRMGYEFEGWYTAPVGGERVDFDSTTVFSESVTLYAYWKENDDSIVPNNPVVLELQTGRNYYNFQYQFSARQLLVLSCLVSTGRLLNENGPDDSIAVKSYKGKLLFTFDLDNSVNSVFVAEGLTASDNLYYAIPDEDLEDFHDMYGEEYDGVMLSFVPATSDPDKLPCKGDYVVELDPGQLIDPMMVSTADYIALIVAMDSLDKVTDDENITFKAYSQSGKLLFELMDRETAVVADGVTPDDSFRVPVPEQDANIAELFNSIFGPECTGVAVKFLGKQHTHIFGEWAVTKAPTATDKGAKERVCSECGYKETAEIAATGENVQTKPVDANQVAAAPEKPNNPPTGDNTAILVCIAMLSVMGTATVGTVILRRKKNENGAK